ncbi:outer membrane lipoprotein LolB [Chitinibacter bivalviorum]|uniref:Outer-membrane lipoprotein LolB n=1 Tax=Chitinibacter bivalviorum TaxID=2739434 RepID=A0A7H9BKQ6_9NEIS|nr:lipoprotein insertase outer membrane protein LolB [Chitinibacter bivalviorum]QLG88906.1 outer membrane lipoprotein LolB [Chitinibacter bivalviorum]
MKLLRCLSMLRVWLASAVMLLAACAQTPLAVPPAGFAATGKINIRQANQSDTAQFSWVAAKQQDQLILSSPFGTTLAELVLQYQGDRVSSAVLNRGEQLDQADDPEQLLQQLTGLTLPVSGMRWWLRGLPSPNEPFAREGEVLLQNGWRITPSDYRNTPLPYRIELLRDDLKVRILINEWNSAAP